MTTGHVDDDNDYDGHVDGGDDYDSDYYDQVDREVDDDIFAGTSRNATKGEAGGSRCNSRLHPKPASSQTGELLGKNYACSK